MIDTRGATNAGATIAGKITGAFSPYFTGSQLSGGNPGTMTLTNSSNDWSGDTVLLNGRVSIGGDGEVIPDGPGKGNLVMVGEGLLTAGLGTNTYLNLNGKTETVNGLISGQGFQGNPSDPTRIFIENSTSNTTGRLVIGNNNATSTFAGTIRDANTATAGAAFPPPTNAFVAITKIGSGTLTLSGTNTYTGGTIVSGGTLFMGNAAAIGGITGPLEVNTGGTLDVNGNSITVGALSGTGGAVTTSVAGPITLTVDTATSATAFGGAIQDGAGTFSFVKTGAGQTILSGTSTYSGTTDVQNGALVVNGSLISTGSVTVQSGAILSGTGSVGNVTMAGGSNLRPGALGSNGAIGTLTANSLTVNGGELRFDLSSPGTNDKVTVTGTANFVSSSTVLPYFSVAVPVAGAYNLLHANSVTGTAPTSGFPTGSRFNATVTTTATDVNFNLTGSAKSLTWTGNAPGDGSTWDLQTTQNWSDNGGTTTNEKFFTFDTVTFNDTAAPPANRNIIVSGQLQPGPITVTHNTGSTDFVFSAGSIVGDFVSFTKLGTGSVSLSTNNDTYGGGTFIKNGTLRVGTSTAIPTGSSVTLGDGSTNTSGTLDLAGLDATVSGLATAGTGTENTIGNGNLGISNLIYMGGNSTFSGKVLDVIGTNNSQKIALAMQSGSLTLSARILSAVESH